MADPQTTPVQYVGAFVSVSTPYGEAAVGGDPLHVPEGVAAALIARGDFKAADPATDFAPKPPALTKPTTTTPTGASAETE